MEENECTTSDNSSSKQAIQLREDAEGKIHLVGKRDVEILTLEQLENVLQFCFSNRLTRETMRNSCSSRSHAILTFTLESSTSTTTTTTSLRIVDLAGSERMEDTTNHSKELIEQLKGINSSLGCLKECIRASRDAHLQRAKKGNVHLPYRRSKLTLLLRDAFEVKESSSLPLPHVCLFIAHLNPLRSSIKHTLNTLDYLLFMVEKSRAELKAATLSGPEAWTKTQTVEWVASLQDGKFQHLAPYFQITGIMLSTEWLGHLERRVCAAGGTENDAREIYEAFHDLKARHKKSSMRSLKK